MSRKIICYSLSTIYTLRTLLNVQFYLYVQMNTFWQNFVKINLPENKPIFKPA